MELYGFFALFLFTYLSGHFLIFRKWPAKLRQEASSSLISLAHGAPAVFMATRAVMFKYHGGVFGTVSISFALENTNLQNKSLEFSIAYFTIDLLHYLVFFPNDVVFIAHHLGTLYVFLTCRWVVGHGAAAVLTILAVAEATSPCQNVWSLARLRRGRVYEWLCVPFLGFYSIVRGVVGPVVVWELVGFYWSGAAEGAVPPWAWGSWVAVTVVGVAGSVLWVLGHGREWYRERSGKVREKRR